MSDSSECLFCAIVDGTLPAHVVYEDDAHVAFLDKSPLFVGHVLLVPRPHVVALSDLDASRVAPLFLNVQKIARAVERAMGADGTFVAINNKVSQSVPHLHVHVVPRKTKDGLRGFFWPRQKYASQEAMAVTAAHIRAAIK
jgi:histidine triad (HIT) family protein